MRCCARWASWLKPPRRAASASPAARRGVVAGPGLGSRRVVGAYPRTGVASSSTSQYTTTAESPPVRAADECDRVRGDPSAVDLSGGCAVVLPWARAAAERGNGTTGALPFRNGVCRDELDSWSPWPGGG